MAGTFPTLSEIAENAPRAVERVQRARAAREARKELARRELERRSLLAFVKGRSPFEYCAGWVHIELCEKLEAFMEAVERREAPRLIITVPPRHGKALDPLTPIATLRGMEYLKDIKTGDTVIGSNGRPTRVVATAEWDNRECYQVTTDDGVELIADAAHEWEVRLDRKRPQWKIYTTKQLAERTSPRKPAVRMVAVEGEQQSLPIDPYVLGVWLGDGSRHTGQLTLSDSDAPQMFPDECLNAWKREGRNGCHRYVVTGLSTALRQEGLLNNKHIPEAYFHASIEQRMALLRGLIDTDGYVAEHGQVEFCSVCQQLATDVRRLVHSLGVKASLCEGEARIDGRYISQKYRVLFYMAGCATIPRKAARTKDGTKQPHRYLSFKKLPGTRKTKCIQVDAADHLYLAGAGYVLTHNSYIASESFPPWVLGHHPDWEVVSATYGQSLADTFGRRVRETLNSDRYKELFPKTFIDPRTNSASLVATTKRGGYRAVGIGGGLTGAGAHVLLIDDPVKDREEAESDLQRDNVWDWYSSVARTRLAPGGGIIVIQTRWHMDDLSGRLIEHAKKNPAADQFDVIDYPAIALRDEAHRKKGEALHPARFTVRELNLIRASLLPRDWNALYQQKPTPDDGDVFRHKDFIWYHDRELPDNLTWYVSVDPAITQKEHGDYTVIWPFALDEDGIIWFGSDVTRERLTPDQLLTTMFSRAKEHKAIAIVFEGGTIYRSMEHEINRRMQEMGEYFQVLTPAPTKDKVLRARPLAARMAHGRVRWPAVPFMQETILPEMLAFPNSKYDDCVDAAAWPVQTLQDHILPVAPTVDRDGDDEDDEELADMAAGRRTPHSPRPLLGGARRRGSRYRYA